MEYIEYFRGEGKGVMMVAFFKAKKTMEKQLIISIKFVHTFLYH